MTKSVQPVKNTDVPVVRSQFERLSMLLLFAFTEKGEYGGTVGNDSNRIMRLTYSCIFSKSKTILDHKL